MPVLPCPIPALVKLPFGQQDIKAVPGQVDNGHPTPHFPEEYIPHPTFRYLVDVYQWIDDKMGLGFHFYRHIGQMHVLATQYRKACYARIHGHRFVDMLFHVVLFNGKTVVDHQIIGTVPLKHP